MFNNPGSALSFTEWATIAAWLWMFVSCVAGVITLAQYLYKHLHWIA